LFFVNFALDHYIIHQFSNAKKILSNLGDEVTAVTAQTKKIFISEISPQPPTSDRPISKITKVDDYVEYLRIGDQVEWLEIAFHKYAVAKDWEVEISRWGCQTTKPEQIRRNGKKFLLRVKGLTVARLEQLLVAELGQSPRQLTR
jgi:hypothetical protein